MRTFNSILYVTNGIFDETAGLRQALQLVMSNKGTLDVLLVYPALLKAQKAYTETYSKYLEEQLHLALEKACEALNFDKDKVPVRIIQEEVVIPPAIKVIRHVLREGYDLVIKEAEPREHDKGFGAMDMTLLRKCPSTVWLARPVLHKQEKFRFAVAIDAESREPSEKALSIRLLELSRSMADKFNGSLSVLSCWDYEYEQFLRYKAWANISEEEHEKNIKEADSDHQALLNALIEESGIGANHEVFRMRGWPDTLIPEFVEREHVDILVMGTVARTGILGFLIGNTAENIVNTMNCSLLALKPSGFVSPVKAFS
ncbi:MULTISPECIES: universal stress protein [Prosthecochloris]|uniref:Universal stress protein n=1 Tax=Prosthecochloris marina TaxID=2017681 RepID=A0A317T8T0_9CHLB|nr:MULTISPECIES: universal stress protein [Prosthecochloris]PWW83123.1 universal stress protein [Prosthecochloris marina]UZJ38734.1 universal stress protein [Prosthecochloris sp. SCSIO W1103]